MLLNPRMNISQEVKNQRHCRIIVVVVTLFTLY